MPDVVLELVDETVVLDLTGGGALAPSVAAATAAAATAVAAAAEAEADAASLAGKMASLPGPDDLVFTNGDTEASFAEGSQFHVTPDDIDHPLITQLKAGTGFNVPGPASVSFYDVDGTEILTIDQGAGEDLPALDRVSASVDAGELLPVTNLVILGDSLSTVSLGFANEVAARFPERDVIGWGIGGQQAADLAVRMGAEAVMSVTANTIPASGGGVVVSLLEPDPFRASIGSPASFVASVYDVPGVLKKVGAVYTFTRSDVGGPVPVPAACPFRLLSGFVANETAAGAVLLEVALRRTAILRYLHNDIFNDVIRDLDTYDRETVKDFVRAATGGMRSAVVHAVVCSITRGGSWLTDARAQALGHAPGVGQSADDAETIAAVIEGQALNQWLADTYPGYVDLMAAYEAAEPVAGDYIASIDLGAGHVYKFVKPSLFPDGTHGVEAGLAQNIDADAIEAKILEKGW